jgi:hypothetical protein
MRRFVIAFGHTIYSFGFSPILKRVRSDDFVVLFGREQTPGRWS